MAVEIRLKWDFQGPRQDGQRWPGYNGVMAVSEQEADNLVTNGHAVYLEDEPEAKVTGWKSLTGEPETDPEEDPLEFEDENSGEPAEVKRPYTTHTVGQWRKYAIHLGADPEVVKEMTKAALIQEYGASL